MLFLLLMRQNLRKVKFQSLTLKTSTPRKTNYKFPQSEILTERNLPQFLLNRTAHIFNCHLIRRICNHANSRKFFFVLHRESKGGVGKSILSMLLADFLTQYRKRKIILVESDTSNPDVGKTFIHSDEVEVLSLSLDEADGWIELVNYCEALIKTLL